MSVARWLGWSVVCAALAACQEAPCGPARSEVSRVLDGDTLELVSGEQVRHLLVDAPELARGDCYAAQALARHRALVVGRVVELVYEEECGDRYGRHLAFVFAHGMDVSRTLIAEGAARVLWVPPNGAARVAELRALEALARAGRLGLWGGCDSGGAERTERR